MVVLIRDWVLVVGVDEGCGGVLEVFGLLFNLVVFRSIFWFDGGMFCVSRMGFFVKI